MESATKAIVIAATVVITLAIITIGFLMLRSGQDTAKDAISQMDKTTKEVSESAYTTYDGLETSGSEVLNAIKKFNGEKVGIGVTVNGASGTVKWYLYTVESDGKLGTASSAAATESDIQNAKDVTKTTVYINPNGKFMGEVVRDPNGAITGIKFKQQ